MSITDEIVSVRQTLNREYRKPSVEKLEKFKVLLFGNDSAMDYLLKVRGLTEETIKHFQLGYDSDKEAIAIPIFKNNELINIKYRFLEPKDIKYTSESGAETWLYNENGIEQGEEKGAVLIVEGEFDLMSCWQNGIKNVVSPASGKDSYGVWVEMLDNIKRVYIAYDNDEAGKTAGRKFAERIGTDRCFEVKYKDGIKDANDFFKTGTIDEYKKMLRSASPYYSYQFKNLGDVITDLRNHEYDELELSVVPKVKIEKDWLMVVSGLTNVGKTSYTMNIANELAGRGIPSLIMPFERGIASVGKRFLQVFFDKSMDDFKFTSVEEWDKMVDQVVDAPVYFSTPKREDINEIIIKSKKLFDTKVVIIDHLDYLIRNGSGNRADEISNTLQKLKAVAIEHKIIIIIVTHVRKGDTYGVQKEPTLDDLKGSSSLSQDPECVVLLSSSAEGFIKVNVAKNKGELSDKSFTMKFNTGRMIDNLGEY
jgi:twinkle protein